jgi:nucleotide-binding universal stress UspA family protein
MALRYIAVGYDGSAASEEALRWALREVVGSDAMLLLVTACPPPAPEVRVTGDEHVSAMARAFKAQWAAIAAAKAAMPDGVRRVAFASEVVPAEPVTALCRAARQVGLLVLGSAGSERLDGRTIAGCVASRLSAERRGRNLASLIVVAMQGGSIADVSTQPQSLQVRIGPVPRTMVPAHG